MIVVLDDDWRERWRRMLELCQPAFLSGFSLPDWIQLLRENNWRVDGRYMPRAVIATIGSMATSLLKPFEPEAKLDSGGCELWQRPVFILGLPCSKTRRDALYMKKKHADLTEDLNARITKVYTPRVSSGLFDTDGLPIAAR